MTVFIKWFQAMGAPVSTGRTAGFIRVSGCFAYVEKQRSEISLARNMVGSRPQGQMNLARPTE